MMRRNPVVPSDNCDAPLDKQSDRPAGRVCDVKRQRSVRGAVPIGMGCGGQRSRPRSRGTFWAYRSVESCPMPHELTSSDGADGNIRPISRYACRGLDACRLEAGAVEAWARAGYRTDTRMLCRESGKFSALSLCRSRVRCVSSWWNVTSLEKRVCKPPPPPRSQNRLS